MAMKYWNKQKEVRERCWTKVQDPFGVWKNVWRDKHKQWCQQQPGGKFWCDEQTTTWYFERQQDAAWFLLKWS
jgi:hypothetical protein